MEGKKRLYCTPDLNPAILCLKNFLNFGICKFTVKILLVIMFVRIYEICDGMVDQEFMSGFIIIKGKFLP